MIKKLKQSQSYSCAPMGDSSDSGSCHPKGACAPSGSCGPEYTRH